MNEEIFKRLEAAAKAEVSFREMVAAFATLQGTQNEPNFKWAIYFNILNKHFLN